MEVEINSKCNKTNRGTGQVSYINYKVSQGIFKDSIRDNSGF